MYDCAKSLNLLDRPVSAAECPLNHGVAVVDQLLAAITRNNDAVALDVALDFRLLLATSQDADEILREFYRLRSVVEEAHYLACFRLRRWLQSEIIAHVKLDRGQPVQPTPIKLDASSYRELCARCAFDAAAGEPLSPWVRISFASAKHPLPSVG
ncbi:MAG TPA: hypothetical protein VL069_09715 [Opitutus sp.]|nr:hypothetical protein [Opitutus sp.]